MSDVHGHVQLRLSNFGNELDFDAGAERNLRDAESAARVRTLLGENFDQ